MIKDIYNVFIENQVLKLAGGASLTVLGFMFDALLAKVFLIVLVLTAIDCMLGYVRAFGDKKHSTSRIMKRYMWKFTGYTITASALFLMSNAMPPEIMILTSWLDNFALAFFAIHEAISIIEHLNELGIPVPTRLLGNLRKIRDITDQNEDEKYSLKTK